MSEALSAECRDKATPLLDQITDVLGHFTRYTVTNGQLTEITDAEGLIFSNSQTVTHVYDDNGSLTKKSTPTGTEKSANLIMKNGECK